MSNEIRLYTDGACKGNPGPGSIGIAVFNHQNVQIYEHGECIGHATNNKAEYRALLKGLELATKFTRGKVVCHLDSELVVKQMNGVWRLKNDDLRDLWHKIENAKRPFKEVTFQHVSRTHQYLRKADQLANNAHNGRPVSKEFLPT